MHELKEMKERLMAELKKYGAKGDMTASTLDVVDKLTHTIKNLCKIIEDYEYSGAMGDGYHGGVYDMSYDRMTPYAMARGRGRGAKRDAMGRYSSSDLIADLRDLMQEAPDERTRREFEQFIHKMETM